MTSEELNERIRAIIGATDLDYEAFGGKAIPYIGWFWRDVDFDAPYGIFGIIPAGVEGNDVPLVGFMQSNKWGYQTIRIDGEEWATIRQALITAATDPTPASLGAANDLIQLLADRG